MKFMNAKLSILLQCTSSSLWQFVLEGWYLFFMQYLPGVFFSTFWDNKKKYGSGRFSGSGADDHQLIFFMALILHTRRKQFVQSCTKVGCMI